MRADRPLIGSVHATWEAWSEWYVAGFVQCVTGLESAA